MCFHLRRDEERRQWETMRRQQLKYRKLNEERKWAAASALLVLAAGQDACEGTQTAAPTCVDPVPELIKGTQTAAPTCVDPAPELIKGTQTAAPTCGDPAPELIKGTQTAAPTCVDPDSELIKGHRLLPQHVLILSRNLSSQTEMTAADIHALFTECENLRSENQELKCKLKTNSLESDSFDGNDDKVRYFTGLPSFPVMLVIFNFICPHMSLKSTLSAFQQFLLTCMRLRLNVSVQYLGYCFGVSTSPASRVFFKHNQCDACPTMGSPASCRLARQRSVTCFNATFLLLQI